MFWLAARTNQLNGLAKAAREIADSVQHLKSPAAAYAAAAAADAAAAAAYAAADAADAAAARATERKWQVDKIREIIICPFTK